VNTPTELRKRHVERGKPREQAAWLQERERVPATATTGPVVPPKAGEPTIRRQRGAERTTRAAGRRALPTTRVTPREGTRPTKQSGGLSQPALPRLGIAGRPTTRRRSGGGQGRPLLHRRSGWAGDSSVNDTRAGPRYTEPGTARRAVATPLRHGDRAPWLQHEGRGPRSAPAATGGNGRRTRRGGPPRPTGEMTAGRGAYPTNQERLIIENRYLCWTRCCGGGIGAIVV
jgi:hypothetical protein